MIKEHPFQPGIRVGLRENRTRMTEEFVDKLHKTGHFTLKGRSGRWRAYDVGGRGCQWVAEPTGDRQWGHHQQVVLWDATTERNVAETKRVDRWRSLHSRFGRVLQTHLTDAMLDAIEAALPSEKVSVT